MTKTRTVLVAGATGNVGGATAHALAKRGAHVVLLGRKREPLEARADSIRAGLSESEKQATTLDVLTLDLSDMASVSRAAAEALYRFPTIDGLVLSAVTLIQDGPNILPNGHEVMFATNVMGPFLFTNLLIERIQQANGMVMHVIAPFYKEVDWEDLESIRTHRTMDAYNRTKTMSRALAAEMARRHAGKVASVAFSPPFVIDKDDPRLAERWPSGFMGAYWGLLTKLFAKRPAAAGEPIAELMLSDRNPHEINGALFKPRKRVDKPDKAMADAVLGRRLWDELAVLTGLSPTVDKPAIR